MFDRLRFVGRPRTSTMTTAALAMLLCACVDPPPPPGMGAFILGVRVDLPDDEEDRVLVGGRRENLDGLQSLRVRALSVRVVHRTDLDDPATQQVIEVFSERTDLDLARALEEGPQRTPS